MSRGRGPLASMSRSARGVLVALFVLSVLLRVGTFTRVHDEGDERLYHALVEQLDKGRGYTLHGHPVLDLDWMVKDQYDRPLFYHPPGAIVAFWGLNRLFGARGFDIAQLLSHTLFFWSVVGLARIAIPKWSVVTAVTVGGLAAFHPIVGHVHTHHWLDGPQTALVALGAALFLRGLSRNGLRGWLPAGLALGGGCLVKLNALTALPGIIALAVAARDHETPRSRLVPRSAALLLVAAAFALPWLWVQWRFYGEILPSWAGMPSARLVAENPFVNYVTLVRTPWSYLRLLPQTVWTLVPSLLMLVAGVRRARSRNTGIALVVWMAAIVAVSMALGGLGYSKLLRYVVLIAPASILLFALTVTECAEAPVDGERSRSGRWLVRALLVLAALGFLLEVAHGLQTLLVYPDRAWIRPLFGDPG